jgi:hypothetical protein
MAKQYLDYDGLQVVWSQIVARDEAEASARATADQELDGRLDTIEASLGGEGTIGSRVGTLESEMDTAQSDITTLQGLHANGADGKKTVAQEVSDGITALNLSTTYAGKSYEGKVDTLIGSDASKSVRTIAAEEIAAELADPNRDTDFDTLKEIADWIQDHPKDAANMNSAISALQTKTTLGNDPKTGEEYATVKGYVDDQIAAVNGDASTLAGRVSTNEGDISALKAGLGTSNDAAAVAGTTAWSRIADNQARLTAVEGRATALETRATTIEGRLGTADDTASAAGTTVWSRLKNAEGDIDTLQGLVGNTAVSTQISTAIAGLDADLDASGTAANGGIFVVSGVTEVDGKLTAVDSVEVDAAGAATTAKNQVIGASGDAASANTVFGAKAYADAAATAATEPIPTSDLNTLLGITEG